MNEPSGLAPEVVTIRDLHIRFNLGREKKTSLFRPAAKRSCMRSAASALPFAREKRSAS